jgi:uncharacterized protein (DUF433 family)
MTLAAFKNWTWCCDPLSIWLSLDAAVRQTNVSLSEAKLSLEPMEPETFSIREAGYVTNLAYASVNRMIDSRRVPRGLLAAGKRGRMLTVAGVLFVAIEKEAEGGFTAALRKKLRQRLQKDLRALESSGATGHDEVSVELGGLRGVVEVDTVRKGIGERLQRVRRMHELITEAPDIQGGAPTFAGTRILVRPIAAALREGEAPEALLRAYPRLTGEMLEMARLYDQMKPARGRPKEVARGLQPKSVRRFTRPA